MPQITVDEQHYKNLRKIAGKMLVALFEMYSEKYFAAGWMRDLEHTLWERSKAKVRSPAEVTDQDSDLFDILLISQVIDSWVKLDHNGEPVVVPIETWVRFHDQFIGKNLAGVQE